MRNVDCPLDYSLCQQTVTVYRKQTDGIYRQVVENCFFRLERHRKVDALGCRGEKTLLLIVPGDTRCVFPGDRVMEGVGPEVSAEAWSQFVPALVEGLAQVSYATPFVWEGRLCHVEAGGKA